MKKLLAVFMLLVFVISVTSGCSSPAAGTVTPAATQSQAEPTKNDSNVPRATPRPSVITYPDGVYEFEGKKDGEGYFVKGTLTVSGNKIASAKWSIFDSNRNDKVFDKDYEVVFSDDMYIQQCRDNLKGMADYEPQLIQNQDILFVDAVTGATWAYHKFEEFVKGALKKAEAE